MDIPINNELTPNRSHGISFFEVGETIIPETKDGIDHVIRMRKMGSLGRVYMELDRFTPDDDNVLFDDTLGDTHRAYSFTEDGQLRESIVRQLALEGMYHPAFYFPDLTEEVVASGNLRLNLSHAETNIPVQAKIAAREGDIINEPLRSLMDIPDGIPTVVSTGAFDPEPGKTKFFADMMFPADAAFLSKLRISVSSSGGGVIK